MSQLSHAQFPLRRHPNLLVDHRRSRSAAVAEPRGANGEAVTGSGGRLHFGMVAGIKSERWPTSNRNPRPDCLGIRNAGAKPEENGFDERAIVRRRAAHMAFTTRQNVFDPIPLIVAQCISSHRSALLGADHSRVRHLLIRESLAYPKHKTFCVRFQSVLASTEDRP